MKYQVQHHEHQEPDDQIHGLQVLIQQIELRSHEISLLLLEG
jgi:hypothetical protein